MIIFGGVDAVEYGERFVELDKTYALLNEDLVACSSLQDYVNLQTRAFETALLWNVFNTAADSAAASKAVFTKNAAGVDIRTGNFNNNNESIIFALQLDKPVKAFMVEFSAPSPTNTAKATMILAIQSYSPTQPAYNVTRTVFQARDTDTKKINLLVMATTDPNNLTTTVVDTFTTAMPRKVYAYETPKFLGDVLRIQNSISVSKSLRKTIRLLLTPSSSTISNSSSNPYWERSPSPSMITSYFWMNLRKRSNGLHENEKTRRTRLVTGDPSGTIFILFCIFIHLCHYRCSGMD